MPPRLRQAVEQGLYVALRGDVVRQGERAAQARRGRRPLHVRRQERPASQVAQAQTVHLVEAISSFAKVGSQPNPSRIMALLGLRSCRPSDSGLAPIQTRIAKLAPFPTLDHDPYPVIDDGRLFGIQDAYTVGERFPYAEPTADGISYIRNSVKVVVDAYQGDVTFYAVDPKDPVLRVYNAAFPGLFRPIQAMPPGLLAETCRLIVSTSGGPKGGASPSARSSPP